MKIGFTERGDAGIDLSWSKKLHTVDGAILITKNANKAFRKAALEAHEKYPNKIIIHVGCTGMGSTWVEPNVPHPTKQLDAASRLVEAGFPLDHIVVRVDPIIPTKDGVTAAKRAILGAQVRGLIGTEDGHARLRISVYDEYRHVKQRLLATCGATFYEGDRFYANDEEFARVADMLAETCPDIDVRTCAEPKLAKLAATRGAKVTAEGCLSLTDLRLMGLDLADAPSTKNAQNRSGCLCLSCKQELLTNRKQCPHKCVYCYWRDE